VNDNERYCNDIERAATGGCCGRQGCGHAPADAAGSPGEAESGG